MINRFAGEMPSRFSAGNTLRLDNPTKGLVSQPKASFTAPYRSGDSGVLKTLPGTSFLPGGCTVMTPEPTRCGLPNLNELAVFLKQAVDFVSGLLGRMSGNDKQVGGNGPGVFDPRELSPLYPSPNDGAARPGKPTFGSSTGLDLDGRTGGGRRHPDCNLPKR